MLSRLAIAAPLLLLAQTGMTYWATSGERIPPNPQLSRLPSMLGDWQQTGEEPIAPDTLQQLGADATRSLLYYRPGDFASGDAVKAQAETWNGSLFVAWFQSQRGGASQPHSPQVCLPAAGWVASVSDRIPMDVAGERTTVNRYIANYGEEKVVVLYWYQTRARVIASEWAAKFWVIVDRLKEKRTDTSLVRVVVWNRGRSNEATTAAALTLAQQAYPVLTDLFGNTSRTSNARPLAAR